MKHTEYGLCSCVNISSLRYYTLYETTTFAIFSSLITMSTKYDFCDIRLELVKHLAQYFPDSLAEYDNSAVKLLFSDPPDNWHFQLLPLVHALNFPVLLPLLIYFCAVLCHSTGSSSHSCSYPEPPRIAPCRSRANFEVSVRMGNRGAFPGETMRLVPVSRKPVQTPRPTHKLRALHSSRISLGDVGYGNTRSGGRECTRNMQELRNVLCRIAATSSPFLLGESAAHIRVNELGESAADVNRVSFSESG